MTIVERAAADWGCGAGLGRALMGALARALMGGLGAGVEVLGLPHTPGKFNKSCKNQTCLRKDAADPVGRRICDSGH